MGKKGIERERKRKKELERKKEKESERKRKKERARKIYHRCNHLSRTPSDNHFRWAYVVIFEVLSMYSRASSSV